MLETRRLILRPFTRADAGVVAALAGDRDIALNTLLIPHPYSLADAVTWIEKQEEPRHRGEAFELAVTLKENGSVVGTIGLSLSDEKRRGELGYWIGRNYWGHGYASEAAHGMLRFAFEDLLLDRVFAFHFARNPASGRVLEKIGMTHEGVMRKHLSKWGEAQDLWIWGILRAEFEPRK